MTMKLMDNRKLATIRRIKSIRSIPGADKVVCSEIDGWTAVVKKGQFEEGFLKGTSMLRWNYVVKRHLLLGEIVVYVEIDAWVPIQVAPFLQERGTERLYSTILCELCMETYCRTNCRRAALYAGCRRGKDPYQKVNGTAQPRISARLEAQTHHGKIVIVFISSTWFHFPPTFF